MKRILVTGGGGFVGGNFVRLVLAERPGWHVTVFDSLGGRAHVPVLEGLDRDHDGRFELVRGRVTNAGDLQAVFAGEPFDIVVHFAARNPSGRNAVEPMTFVDVNVVGTAMLLEAARTARAGRTGTFLHLSSYEVYGSSADGVFTEDHPLNPSTPYAASKAAADQLTLAYHRTYGMRTLVTRTTNIYGPFQSLDKLIPTIVSSVVEGRPVPVFGTGENLRDWIHVDDHNRGVLMALESGSAGQVYHLGARCEISNIELIKEVVTATAELTGADPAAALGLLTFVRDRDAHDARRALDPSRSERELGFSPLVPFREGLRDTVKWVLMNSGRGDGR